MPVITRRLTRTCKSNTKGGRKPKQTPASSLKQFENKIYGGRGWKWFCGTGWLLAMLLSCWAAPRIYHRLIFHFPAAQKEDWDQTLAEKERELSSRWHDSRPLIILAGDSQIELGDWYDFFGGAWAMRNCGLSRAKIADVTRLVSAIGDSRPKMVVLMCGINSLGGHESLDSCLHDYEDLLLAVRAHLQPESILVLSVMPVRESAADRASHQFNAEINEFNTKLAACCRQHQVDFLNVNPAVADTNGGLAAELTVDGLHLNREGYRRLARLMAAQLAPMTQLP
jgi:lysophospholipase L1-like esterase